VAEQFPPDSLDINGRDRVRALLKSDDPAEVIAGCRIATATGWRTTVQAMRRLLDHPKPQIRAVAAIGIGALAGPAMEHLLRRRVEQDPDPAVQAAAKEGIAAIASRSRR
jgi:HEAT repeat protein